MKNKLPLIPAQGVVPVATADVQPDPADGRSIATRDHEVIRKWAARHQAEPATGQETASGPATIDVNDGDAGIRFNFPGMRRFRPISWAEWFGHFEQHHLVFVYEDEVAARAYELWEGRGGAHGRDREDWLEAERQLAAARPSRWRGAYRIVQAG